MENFDRKKHWEQVYQTKQANEVSWYQATPETSLRFLQQCQLAKTAKIIDIGGGDSRFVDSLLDLGFQDITILDISQTAIDRAQKRLGARAKNVKWIVQDVVTFQPVETYDFWHDRAAFHFLTDEREVTTYIDTASRHLSAEGILLIGTFSEQGPERCSGINIQQYSEMKMTNRLSEFFEPIKCIPVDHTTPFGTIQHFVFCSFKKLRIS